MRNCKKMSVALVCIVIFAVMVIFLGVQWFLSKSDTTEKKADICREVTLQDGSELIVKHYEPARIELVFDKQIAPDFYVGSKGGNVGTNYEIYLDDPDYDPLNIGVERAVNLIASIRQIPGMTAEIYAKGYILDAYIAETYYDRDHVEGIMSEIIERVDNQMAK